MRTSHKQFATLVNYMEMYGDLSRPPKDVKGRIKAMESWDHLTSLLNSDESGDVKSIEKWKKVWSDLKNNTKRKAARMHRATTGTHDGPKIYSKISDLEKRVLKITGFKTETGSVTANADDSLQQIATPSHLPSNDPLIQSVPSPQATCTIVIKTENDNEPQPSYSVASSASPQNCERELREANCEDEHLEGTEPESAQESDVATSISGYRSSRTAREARRYRYMSRLSLLKKRAKQSAYANKYFLRSEAQWRKFEREKLKINTEIENERLRLKGVELSVRKEWAAIGNRMLTILEKFVNTFCED